MSSLSHYYGKARGSVMGISPKEATELAEDWAVAGLMGAALGAIASQAGGLDKTIGGITVPLDGLAAAACALTGLSMKNKQLQTASIAAVGSASTRIFTKALSKGITAHGEYETALGELPSGNFGHHQLYGYGSESNDRLVEAAKYL